MLKQANIADAPAFIKIKEALPMLPEDNREGGFLLGTSQAMYEWYIQNAYVLALWQQQIEGFGIVIPDKWVKQGELWEKRTQVQWQCDLAWLENQKIAYFEQLAMHKGNKRNLLKMVYHLVHKAFQEGHQVLLTTTVVKPKLNLAAVPLILKVGGEKIGNIDEVYEKVGQINSDVYMIQKDTFYQHLDSEPIGKWLKNETFDWL